MPLSHCTIPFWVLQSYHNSFISALRPQCSKLRTVMTKTSTVVSSMKEMSNRLYSSDEIAFLIHTAGSSCKTLR
jgi:hypothetical protein